MNFRFWYRVILVTALLSVSSLARSQDAFFSSGEGLEKIGLIFEQQTYAAAGPLPSLEIQEQRAAISIPIYRGEMSTWAFTARGQRTVLNRSLAFADRGVSVPKEFGTGEVGAAYTRKTLTSGRMAVNATVGGAGTQIFSNGRTPILTASFVLDKPAENGNSWLYFVNYSNNRTLLNNIPLPGIAYAFKKPTSTIVLGLPFSFILWRPDPWMLVSVISPFVSNVEVAYRFWGPLQLYSGVAWNPRAYQNLVEGSEDRLIYNKKEASLGVRAFLGPKGSLSLAYTQEFDRKFLLGRSVGDASSDKISIESSGGVQLKVRLNL